MGDLKTMMFSNWTGMLLAGISVVLGITLARRFAGIIVRLAAIALLVLVAYTVNPHLCRAIRDKAAFRFHCMFKAVQEYSDDLQVRFMRDAMVDRSLTWEECDKEK